MTLKHLRIIKRKRPQLKLAVILNQKKNQNQKRPKKLRQNLTQKVLTPRALMDIELAVTQRFSYDLYADEVIIKFDLDMEREMQLKPVKALQSKQRQQHLVSLVC